MFWQPEFQLHHSCSRSGLSTAGSRRQTAPPLPATRLLTYRLSCTQLLKHLWTQCLSRNIVVLQEHFAGILQYLGKASSFDSTSGNRLVLCFFACAQLPLTLCNCSRSDTCPPPSGQRAIMRVSDRCISQVLGYCTARLKVEESERKRQHTKTTRNFSG